MTIYSCKPQLLDSVTEHNRNVCLAHMRTGSRILNGRWLSFMWCFGNRDPSVLWLCGARLLWHPRQVAGRGEGPSTSSPHGPRNGPHHIFSHRSGEWPHRIARELKIACASSCFPVTSFLCEIRALPFPHDLPPATKYLPCTSHAFPFSQNSPKSRLSRWQIVSLSIVAETPPHNLAS